MIQIKKLWLIAAPVAIAIVSISFILLPFFIKSEPLQNALNSHLEELTRGALTSERLSLSYFPRLAANLHGVTLNLGGGKTVLKSREVKVYLKYWPFLFRKTDISGLALKGGELTLVMSGKIPFEKLALQSISVQVKSIRAGRPMKILVSGELEGQPKSFSGKATLTVDQFEKPDFQKMVLVGEMSVFDFDLKRLQPRLRPGAKWNIQDGKLRVRGHVRKALGDKNFDCQSETSLEKFTYQWQQKKSALVSTPLDSNLKLDFSWQPETEKLTLKRGTLTSPIGSFDLSGKAELSTFEISEMRLGASEIILEAIPQYVLSAKDWIPLNTGFSGKSSLEMTAKGTLDHLSLHGNWDLTPTLFTYGRYFSKPKDLPFSFIFDYLLKDHQTLSGDFSTKFQDMVTKGNIVGWDLSGNEGQINILTNKFKLAGFEAFLPPLEKFKLEGEIKILANWKGNMLQPQGAETMLNVTLEDAGLVPVTGAGIRHASVAFDYGPVLLRAEKFRAEIGQTPVAFDLLIKDFRSQPEAKLEVSASRLLPADLLNNLQAIASDWIPAELQTKMKRLRNELQSIFPSQEPLDQFSATVDYKEGLWTVPDLAWQGYQGTGKAKLTLRLPLQTAQKVPDYSAEFEWTRVSLANFLKRNPTEEIPVYGNLFLKAQIKGNDVSPEGFLKHLTGTGTFSITNGEFPKLDALATLGSIDQFGELKKVASGKTSFSDLRAPFEIRDAKLTTDRLTLISGELTAEGKGEAALDTGTLNGRVEAFLSKALTDKVLAPLWNKNEIEGDQQFGPFPLLLTGSLKQPELKPDTNLLPKLLEDFRNKKTHRVLRNFLPEALPLERRDS